MVLSFDPWTLASKPAARALLLNKAVVAVNQDPDAVMGSLVPMPGNPAGASSLCKQLDSLSVMRAQCATSDACVTR